MDLHSHYLPGVDDGADSLKTTMRMVKMAHAEGIRTICMTPHYKPGANRKSGLEIKEIFQNTREILEGKYSDMTFFLGNEWFYSQDMPQLLSDKRGLPLGEGKHVLVEFAPGVYRQYMHNSLYHLLQEGFIPVLAHVERYACLLGHQEEVEVLVRMGVCIQVNSKTVTLPFYQPVRRFVHQLMKNRLVHLICTDAHDPEWRKPVMQEAYALICHKYGEAYAKAIFIENGKNILGGKSV